MTASTKKKNSPKKKGEKLVKRASKSILDEFYRVRTTSPHKQSEVELVSKYDLNKVIQVVKNDSTAWAGITTIVDRTIEPGWFVRDAETGERRKDVESRLKNLGFRTWLRNHLITLLTFNNSFGELVRTPTGWVKEIHNLDPSDVKIYTDKHGEVKHYAQEIGGETVQWLPEEILHTSFGRLDTNVWGEVDIRTVYDAARTKWYIKNFLLWLFKTNQFRGFFNIKEGADEQAIREFVNNLRQVQDDPYKPLVAEGEVAYQLLRGTDDLESMTKLLYKFDEEILNLLQVPPIFAGLPDNSNRSNSDAQERAFNTRIRGIHDLLEDKFTRELLPKLGIFKAEFEFGPLGVKNEKDVFENAERLRNMGVKDNFIEDYFKKSGFEIPRGGLFKKEDFAMKKSMDMFPSRQGKTGDEANEKIGTGEESTTREDQLVTRATKDKFSDYPYVYEVRQENAV